MFLLRGSQETELSVEAATVWTGGQKLEANWSVARTDYIKVVVWAEVPENGVAESRTCLLSK